MVNESKIVSLKWETGHIDFILDGILDMSASELKKFVSAATVNGEEIKAEIAAFLRPIIKAYSNDSVLAKKAEKYKKLMAVVEDRKLSKVDKIVQKLFNNKNPNRLCHAVFEDAGKYCATDGHILFRFSSPLSSDIPTMSYDYNTERAFGDINAFSIDLELPKPADLRKDIKIAKYGADIGRVHSVQDGNKIIAVYDFGYGLPKVNAEYLLSMLDALPGCKAHAYSGNAYAPVYFVSGDNDGLIMPIRTGKEYENPPADVPADVSADTMTENVTETKEEAEKKEDAAPTKADIPAPTFALPAPKPVLYLPAPAVYPALPAPVSVSVPVSAHVEPSGDSVNLIVDSFRALYFDGTHTIIQLAKALSVLCYIPSENAIEDAFNFLGLEYENVCEEYEDLKNIGDAVDIESAGSVFGSVSDIPISVSDIPALDPVSVLVSVVTPDTVSCPVPRSDRACGRAGPSAGYGYTRNAGGRYARSPVPVRAARSVFAVYLPKSYKPPGHWVSALSAFYT